MGDFFTPFHQLRYRASESNQRPTHWWFGVGGREEVRLNAKPDMFELYPTEKLFGIRTGFDPDLPRNRVVLKAGKSTIGVFTIGQPAEDE